MKSIFFILLGTSLLFIEPVYANTKPSHLVKSARLTKNIDRLIKSYGVSKSSLGILITDKSFKNIYQLNENKLFIPASLTKVASLSAFYHYYPHHFTFKSMLASLAEIKNNQLNGDIVFKGGGDPSFTSQDLWNLVNVFTRTGIKKINGDIIIDNSLYKKPYYKLAYTDRSYTATVSPSSFNWNSVTFWIRPGDKAGSQARIFTDPKNTFIKIINKVKTVTSKKKSKVFLKRTKYSAQGETFVLSGSISVHSKELVKYSNVQQPSLYLGYNILNFLKQRGIAVTGTVKTGKCSSCKVLAKVDSKPFKFQAHNMMKYSNNFVARMLTSHLPLVSGAKKGDLYNGIKLINKYLKNTVGLKGYSFVEPSGLDRSNKFSPNHFKKILEQDRSHFYQAEIFSSYPLVDGQGTLKNRFKNKNNKVNIRAKTGLLSGVAALLGHAELNKKEIIFVFLFNGSAKKSYKAKTLFDKIILKTLHNKDI